MNPKLARAAALSLCLCLCASGLRSQVSRRRASRAQTPATGRSWWRHVEQLADDRMEGRATGSEGHRRAAEYVAHEFEGAGLKPAGISGWFQPVRLRTRRVVEEQSHLALVRGGVQEVVELGEDFFFNLRSDPASNLQAAAVFVGYGLVAPESNHNDLAGLDLKGKIAVYLQGGPGSIPGPLRAHYQSSRERWKALQAAGAIGAAAIPNPKSMDIPWERMKLTRALPSMSLADEAFAEAPGQRIALTINPAAADKFFTATDHTMAEILSLADADKPLPRFPLAYAIRASVMVERGEAESDNVIGILPGTDARLRNEYVLLTAHLDHLGIGSPIDGDSIYNGAMDNASGVASLIEIARMLKASPPRRSVIFAAVTGEEKGLLGSQYLAAFAPVARGAIVANLNLDMFLPIHKLRVLDVYGIAESTLGALAREVAVQSGLRVVGDPEPERNIFIRSDQYSFIRRGVPSLYFKFGYEKGSPQEKLQKEWLRQRYHSPSDDLNQPVDAAAADQFNRFVAAMTRKVANAPQRPRWNPGSFFRRYTERET